MTNEEAKDYIREWCPYDRQEEIIKAIEQEPCEDCISRKDALLCLTGRDLPENRNEYIGIVNERLKGLPSIQPVVCIGKVEFDEEKLKDIVHETIENYSRPKGEWINTRPPEKSDNIVCSLCGFDSIADYKFCPNCGAKMESEDKE